MSFFLSAVDNSCRLFHFIAFFRIDDVINVAGHRLDTGRIEEVIVQNKNVIETAVIGLNHKSKGEVPIAIIVLKENLD